MATEGEVVSLKVVPLLSSRLTQPSHKLGLRGVKYTSILFVVCCYVEAYNYIPLGLTTNVWLIVCVCVCVNFL